MSKPTPAEADGNAGWFLAAFSHGADMVGIQERAVKPIPLVRRRRGRRPRAGSAVFRGPGWDERVESQSGYHRLRDLAEH